MLTVATWNVLHRIHGENWGEDVVRQWPDERERIAAITRMIGELDADVIALQEVSGDQLASLNTLPRTVVAFRYPRVPSPRHGSTALQDQVEYLALLADGPAALVAGESFASDPGKGLLAVRVGTATVVVTHVSSGPKSAAQLQRLADVARGQPAPVVVAGDFNARLAVVAAGLGAEFATCDPGPAIPTRPRPAGAAKSTWIDHVFVRGATPVRTTVRDVRSLSDHNLVCAEVRR